MSDEGVRILIALYADRRPSQGDPEGKERSEAEIKKILAFCEQDGEEGGVMEKRQGWGIPANAGRAHYFIDGESLCCDWLLSPQQMVYISLHGDDYYAPPSKCKKCLKKRQREGGAGKERRAKMTSPLADPLYDQELDEREEEEDGKKSTE